jgi:hyperosmotically inducible protein
MITIRYKLLAFAFAVLFGTAAGAVAQSRFDEEQVSQPHFAKKVRKELVTLPFYGVFDNLGYKIEGATVSLYGEVVRPSTRSDAEKRVSRIAGVEQVINKIEVLPLSSFDDSIRVRTFRSIFRTAGLDRYALGANPSIHIIVNRGHVKLEGVVANNIDRQLAYFAANGVSGVFSVTNNLRTDAEIAR